MPIEINISPYRVLKYVMFYVAQAFLAGEGLSFEAVSKLAGVLFRASRRDARR